MIIKSHFSILNSSLRIPEAISKLKEGGFKVAILADKNMFGVLDFYNECKKQEILPIISSELKTGGLTYQVISKNGKGYENLIQIVSTKEAFKSEDIEYVLLDFDNIQDLKEEKLATYVGLNTYTKEIEETFKEGTLKKFAEKRNLPIIPWNVATHLTKEDYRATNALIAIGTESRLDNLCVEGASQQEAYIRTKEEWIQSAPKEWVKNIGKLIKECSTEGYSFGNPTPPHFQFREELALSEGLSKDISEEELFAHMSRKGLKERLKKVEKEQHKVYEDRLEYEINIINQMKFPGYMLIVQDFVLAAKRLNIPVGPGRGSAAGSLVAYALEITNIDPLKYGLLFERFLNPERVTMPDIDMDFSQSRRQEIIDYVIEKYGKEQVAQIITFGKLGAKSVIRDVSRITGFSLSQADRFAKIVPEVPGMTLAKAYEEESEKFEQMLKSQEAKKVWKYARKLEGLNKNLGVHAAGLVITDKPVYTKAPLADVNGTQVVQYEGKYLEDVDLIKFDFLGLKTLSVIEDAIKMIKENHGVTVDFNSMDYNDPKVYEDISNGDTIGKFQIESDGMQKLNKRLQPSSFEDLIAVLALYRPGPLESGMVDDFVARKRGEKPIKYFFDDFEEILKPILEPTYGVIVYQEQVMKIVQEIGGFSLGEADIIRRAMGKKDIKYMEQKAEEFADGAVKKGLNREHAKELFQLIEKFAGYGFNKSHSAGYAVVTYQTAWLKSHYPQEFLAASLNYEFKDQDKQSKYIAEAQRIGIKIEKLDINTSTEFFETDGKSIQFALRAIKGVGVGAEPCIKARKEKPFESFKDFIFRSVPKTGKKMNKRVFTALASSGALDSFGISRKAMIEHSDRILSKDESVFTEIENIEEDFPLSIKIKMEKDLVGMYITDPFEPEPVRKSIEPYDIPKLSELKTGTNYILIFPEEYIERKAKKTKKVFGILKVYFRKETKDVLAFNNAFEQLKKANLNRPLILKVSVKEDGGIFLNSVIDFKKSTLQSYFLLKQ